MGFSEAVNNDVTRCYLEGTPFFNQDSVHVVRLEPSGTILHHPLSLQVIVESLQCRVRPVQRVTPLVENDNQQQIYRWV